MVHGAFVGAWCWQPHFMRYFADQGFSCVAPSLRGHGNSEIAGPLDYAGIREYVADLSSVIADLSGPPPVLIGHSMGALVVQRYLEAHAASAAVLMAPVPRHGLMASTWRLAVSDPMLFAQFGLMQAWGRPAVDKALARRAVFSQRLPESELEQYTQAVERESQRALWEMNVHAAGRPWLADSQVPMRVVAAAEDALFTPQETKDVAHLWDASWVEIAKTGHAMMLEPYWQSAADDVIRWLWSCGIR